MITVLQLALFCYKEDLTGLRTLQKISDSIHRKSYVVSHKRDGNKQGYHTCGFAYCKSWEECFFAELEMVCVRSTEVSGEKLWNLFLLLCASLQIPFMELVMKGKMLRSAKPSAKVIPLSSSLFSNSNYWQFFLEITASNICADQYWHKNLLRVILIFIWLEKSKLWN